MVRLQLLRRSSRYLLESAPWSSSSSSAGWWGARYRRMSGEMLLQLGLLLMLVLLVLVLALAASD